MNQMELQDSIRLLPEIELHLQEMHLKLDRVVYLMEKILRGHISPEDIDYENMVIPRDVYQRSLDALKEKRKLINEERERLKREEDEKLKAAKEFMDMAAEADKIMNPNGRS